MFHLPLKRMLLRRGPARLSRKALLRWGLAAGIVGVLLVALGACASSSGRRLLRRGSSKCPGPGYTLVTGYCNCASCCGWRRSWFGFGGPVYNYGPNKGKPKQVGITAKGTRARRGTIAADPKVYPFGTRLKIPGYGVGTVEDIGGAIKGHHIDLWFPSHAEARRWGRQWLKVERVSK